MNVNVVVFQIIFYLFIHINLTHLNMIQFNSFFLHFIYSHQTFLLLLHTLIEAFLLKFL